MITSAIAFRKHRARHNHAPPPKDVIPGTDWVPAPLIELRYDIEIDASPQDVWPWIRQLGYHRGGWYIDAWWDRIAQEHFWPRIVPLKAQGEFCPSANEILPDCQQLAKGDVVPDGPAGSAFYEVTRIEENRILVLNSTSHFNFMAPSFVYRTRLAPVGVFRWAFVLEEVETPQPNRHKTRLISWWQAEARPRLPFLLLKPFITFVDGIHQRQILKGIKARAEGTPKRSHLLSWPHHKPG